ncbi:acyl-ACP--UDP-N-acetylglucosamine O-acyltransferase [Sideroxydans lithotrophicus]|uniref:Acyl-[acyl-carrier-protein]--UDP-N-acetylglucosamine O-acyltransferase n=1 Tax=Sideroxydans lithotrophicus (strain ES-1) TaxID=580332 RepID=D5CSD6_SIDLE|nr:acyl-ACP--UDP-N-acetylglucosamine O-acyltransferase [Sideroxydans lithotrophicus]ADE11872.1 acyl-(acyl-carrier-protein)--UDP-N-acetylglucosamine O-acyltransferase [Sideroxydans lithotrophicus ES-1]
MDSLRHPTAIIHPNARLADDVSVGPYSIIGEHVEIGAGSVIGPHVVVDGHTTIGKGNRIFQFSSIGEIPQDKKYKGEPTRLIIGDNNTIRESCTLNLGTIQDGGVTSIGNDNWIMAYVHVAHDCHIADHNVIANSVQFAGHVTVGSHTLIGGMSGIHQFVRIGDFAMIGFQTRLSQDLPPFVTAVGNPAEAKGPHQEGPRRAGYSAQRLDMIKQMYRTLYRAGSSFDTAKKEIEALRGQATDADADIENMLTFLSHASRGIVR